MARSRQAEVPGTYLPAQRAGIRFGLTEKEGGSSLVTVLDTIARIRPKAELVS